MLIKEYFATLNAKSMRYYQMQSMIFTFFFKDNVQMKLRLVSVDQTYYLLLIFENISDKVKLGEVNAKLNYSSMLIDSLSHELFTPLHQILTMTKQLVDNLQRDKVSDKEAMKDEIMKINQISLGLYFTVKNMIDYANIINNSFALSPSIFSLRQVFDYIISAFSIKARRKGLLLRADCEKSIEVNTDYERLAGLLYIFVDNSIKFTDKGGILLSASREIDGRVRIKVIDTGHGIAKRDLTVISQIIQNPFLEDKTTNSPGLGIGLRMAQHILRKLTSGDVSIEIRSEQEVGTTVQFELIQYQSENKSRSDTQRSGENEVLVNTHVDLESEKQKEFRKERNLLYNGLVKIFLPSHKISPSGGKLSKLEGGQTPSLNVIKPKKKGDNQHSDDSMSNHSANDQNLIDYKELEGSRPMFMSGKLSTKSARRDVEFPGNSVVIDDRVMFPHNEQNRKCAIVVDDDIFNSDIAMNMLALMGFEVHQAYNGDVAIQMCEDFLRINKKVDLILMDYNMPGKCGDVTTKILRQQRFDPILKDTPIFGVTAQPDQKTKSACLESGMNLVENKPFDFNKLQLILQKFKIVDPIVET